MLATRPVTPVTPSPRRSPRCGQVRSFDRWSSKVRAFNGATVHELSMLSRRSSSGSMPTRPVKKVARREGEFLEQPLLAMYIKLAVRHGSSL